MSGQHIKVPVTNHTSENISPEFTILMPCLNEAATLSLCISEIQEFINSSGLSAEILVSDNGSTDGSMEIAAAMNCRVLQAQTPGYGAAIMTGIAASRGKYIIMGDSDYSYDFSRIQPFVSELRNGYDLVIGNRFDGHMERYAMPFLHKYIGVPFLSFLGRKRFHTFVDDFHCGLRGFSASSIKQLNLHCTGMEWATEMIAAYSRNDLKIKEVPIDFRCDKRKGASHLRTFSDGFRHLRFIIFS